MEWSRKSRGLVVFLFLTGMLWAQQGEVVDGEKYWVFFRDKGSAVLTKSQTFGDGSALGISRRALLRRAKVRQTDNLMDAKDIPVASEYIRSLEDLGLRPEVVSRWLNGVSVEIPPDVLDAVRALSFVKKVQPVVSFVTEPPPVGEGPQKTVAAGASVYEDVDYGYSYLQNRFISVPEVHALGITGEGVLVGMMDTGFDYEGQPVFSGLDVVAEYDFHWDDGVTADEDDDPAGQHNHGTMVLSIIGGFHEGYLVGPAYGASFALAKTEWTSTETRVEEDHWVEGIEWLENLGVDVVSSSLGYNIFDDGFGYTRDQLNGDVCVTTIAADIAASKGVVVVNCAGNERNSSWEKILSPADGDSVIAVGAVSPGGTLTYFSSVGPTADGRIKPDVVAMGMGVYYVSPSRKGEPIYSNSIPGTSFSCPLVAGVCALVLQAHPELGPMEVRDAIRETADRASDPDTLYGWGLVDAYEAVFYHGMIFMNFRSDTVTHDEAILDMDILSKDGVVEDSVFLSYRADGEDSFQEMKMTRWVDGGAHRFRSILPSSVNMDNLRFFVTAFDTLGREHVGPVGAPDVLYSLSDDWDGEPSVPDDFRLSQNYPNPFNSETKIAFYVPRRCRVTLKVYNLLGQEVITLEDRVFNPGWQETTWRGVDRWGKMVSSGIYFGRMDVGSGSEVCKMILVK